MRKLNNRTVFFACVSLTFGVVLSSYQNAFRVAGIFALFIGFMMFVCPLLKNGDGVPRFITAMLMLGFFVVGICMGMAQQMIYEYKYQEVSGDVRCEITEITATSVICKDITVDGEKIHGKAIVKTERADKFEIGDVVEFNETLNPIPIFEKGKINFNFASRVTYRVDDCKIKTVDHVDNLKNDIKDKIKTMLDDMFGDNSGIAYAMTFGDTSGVDNSNLSLLRRGGIAHIFAVSGLHIGLLFWVLRKFSWLKARSSLVEKGIYNSLVLAILLFYVWLCDFTPSSMRAFLMILSGVVLTNFGKIKDVLLAVSVSAFILMLYSPYIIFTIGFQLSFLAVVGICVLPQKITPHLAFLKSEKLANAVAVAVTAFISTGVVACYHFGYISVVSVLLNIAVVPIYSFVYIANMAGLALYGILSWLSPDNFAVAMCPYFTNEIYNFTIDAFRKIENILPLATYITIPLCVVIAYQGVVMIYSALCSEEVQKSRKRVASVILILGLCTPAVVSSLLEERPTVAFYQHKAEMLTICDYGETYMFCKAGEDINFSKAETKIVNVIIVDGDYKPVKAESAEGHEINMYAQFRGDVPKGANTLSDFQDLDCGIKFNSKDSIVYNDVEFTFEDKCVEVKSSDDKVRTIKKAGEGYYAIDGIFANTKIEDYTR